MALELEDLDPATYEELREDAIKRLPVLAPEWTDHNIHDPGITILELLCWLVESHGYELDQITDAHRERYLALAGGTRQPPQPADTELALTVDTEPTQWHLPEQTNVSAIRPDSTTVPFETTDVLAVTPATIRTVIVEDADGRTDRTAANDRADRGYRPFGRDARVDNALYLGFDTDPFTGPDRLDLAVAYDESDLPARGTGNLFDPSVGVDWQHLDDPDDWFRPDGWASMPVARDETDAFYGGGRVTLDRPSDWRGEPAAILGHDEPLVWIRAAVVIQDADATVERYELPPQIKAIRPNVVSVEHAERTDAIPLERIDDPTHERPPQGPTETTGHRGQQFAYPDAPVREARVFVDETEWTVVDSFAASGPDDTHVVLDHAAGTIRFGDGRRGQIPQPGRPVSAREVVVGGGPAGNVTEAARWTIEADGLDATALARPTGGAGVESIEAALERLRRQQDPTRAVTTTDYEAIAVATPGVRVARAAVVAEPTTDEPAAPITVAVIPVGPAGRRPQPTRGFLEAVDRQLCRHRLLTDRTTVVAPTYRQVTVTVTVSPAADADNVEGAIQESLETYIDPLTGFDGDGWPFGRPVYRSDVFARVGAVPGVADVRDVSVRMAGDVDRTTVPVLAGVRVHVRDDREDCRRDG